MTNLPTARQKFKISYDFWNILLFIRGLFPSWKSWRRYKLEIITLIIVELEELEKSQTFNSFRFSSSNLRIDQKPFYDYNHLLYVPLSSPVVYSNYSQSCEEKKALYEAFFVFIVCCAPVCGIIICPFLFWRGNFHWEIFRENFFSPVTGSFQCQKHERQSLKSHFQAWKKLSVWVENCKKILKLFLLLDWPKKDCRHCR